MGGDGFSSDSVPPSSEVMSIQSVLLSGCFCLLKTPWRLGTPCFLASPSKHHLYPMFSTESRVCHVSCFYTLRVPFSQPHSSPFIWWKEKIAFHSAWFRGYLCTPEGSRTISAELWVFSSRSPPLGAEEVVDLEVNSFNFPSPHFPGSSLEGQRDLCL